MQFHFKKVLRPKRVGGVLRIRDFSILYDCVVVTAIFKTFA
jgi:hypothetical protein